LTVVLLPAQDAHHPQLRSVGGASKIKLDAHYTLYSWGEKSKNFFYFETFNYYRVL